MSDLDSRLGAAVKARTELASKVQRLSGRLDAAKANLESIDAECQSRGLDPENLDETIQKLQARYDELVTELETGVREATKSLAPYLSESE